MDAFDSALYDRTDFWRRDVAIWAFRQTFRSLPEILFFPYKYRFVA